MHVHSARSELQTSWLSVVDWATAMSLTSAKAASVLIALVLGFAPSLLADEPPISFNRDVMAVISKAGCNYGACHANATGKGGMKLSLRGEDPDFDHRALARELQQRRINLLQPAESLILLKATSQVAHQGGTRFAKDSQEFEILRRWVAAGAPGPKNDAAPKLERLEVTPIEQVVVAPQHQVQIEVKAHFADGTSTDVRSLAIYELTDRLVEVSHDGLVTAPSPCETTIVVRYLQQQVPVRLAFIPAAPSFAFRRPAEQNYIDKHLWDRLEQLQIQPSPTADDASLLRRLSLDLVGMLPSAEESRSFAADSSPDKWPRAIDRLLSQPEYAEHWTLKWADLLRTEEKVLDSRGVDAFYTWIRDGIAADKPLDQFVSEMIVGQGSTYEVPAANFYRANRDPLTRGETAARLFLGVRLQCARCHNHPFDRWTQDDYYNWSALFSRIDYEIGDNKRKDKLDKNEFAGEQKVLFASKGEVKNERTGKNAEPQFLGAEKLSRDADGDRLPQLASWLTSRENRQFAKAQANFIWYHLMGRGLVHPIDDFRLTNPASHPQLLEDLADQLIANQFQMKPLIRQIVMSQAYQLSALSADGNERDQANYARAVVRRLSAEQLLDAQLQVLDVAGKFQGYPEGTRAGQLRGVERERRKLSGGDRFLRTFGKPARLLACDCERSSETTLKQALVLLGDEDLDKYLTSSEGRLARLASSDMSWESAVDELYWTALARQPTSDELAAAKQILDDCGNRHEMLTDLAWALLNSKEFVFRH